MALKDILEKRFINLPDKHFSNLLTSIKKVINKKSLNLQKIKGIGKGKWLLNFVSIEKNKVDIISLSANEILIKFLKKVIQKDMKINFCLNSELGFWQEKKYDKATNIIKDIFNSSKIQIEIQPIDKELSSYNLKARGNINKEDIIKILQNFFKIFYSKEFIFQDLELEIKNKSYKASIFMDSKEINIHINLTEKKLLKIFNSILFCKNISTPCYYLHYVDIKGITKDWELGKREGYLVQELADKRDKRIKKFKI